MAPRLIVLGWDSATFDVARPLAEGGRLPALASLIERGHSAALRSTWPPMTDCAWTGAFTGVNAGSHGIFGSWYRAPGSYACRYFSARDRLAPAAWEAADGVRWLVWNVPMTYPPSSIDGVMVAGYGAPPGARFCSPNEFQDRLAQRWDLNDLLDRAPHRSLEHFLDQLLRGLIAQADALPWAARATGADCVVAVWPHVDRAQHFFWRFRGTGHPLADAIDRVYVAMDRATQAIIDEFPDADVIVASDHGAGPLKGDVNVGAWLAARGRATYGRTRARAAVRMAWALPPPVRRLGRRLAPVLARRAMGATLAGQLGPFDWTRTDAFLGFHSDLWLNLEGREPAATVSEDDADEVLDEIRDGLLELRDPRDDSPVVAAVHRRDELWHGPAAGMAPDLMLDSWSAGFRVAPGREAAREGRFVSSPARLAGVGEAWSSDHRPTGLFAAAGPRIAPGRTAELALLDLCPTLLALLEQAVPTGLDGDVVRAAIAPSWLRAHGVATAEPTAARPGEGGYSDDDAAAVAAHLRDLGYLE